MKLRILGSALGVVAGVMTLAAFVAGGFLGLSLVGWRSMPAGTLVFGAAVVASILVFRAVHDWVVLRWSNEPDPFVYGEWKPRRG